MLRDKSDELAYQFTRVYWLEEDNASLLTQIGKVNALVDDLEERGHVREEELAQAHRERDMQRAAAEHKAMEVESQAAVLRQNAEALVARAAQLQH